MLCGWEMGTGKTLFAIERDLRFRLSHGVKHTLVIAPLTTHDSWLRALKVEAPGLTIRAVDPKNRSYIFSQPADIYIVHYDVMGDRKSKYGISKGIVSLLRESDIKINHIILDECHRIKNRNIGQTRAVKSLKCPLLTDMSGSPVTDKPQDIWSILNHLKPKDFNSYWRFFHQMTISEKPLVLNATTGRIEPAKYWVTEGPSQRWKEEGLPSISHFYDRVLTKDCLDLPETIETIIRVDLTPKMRKAYDEMRMEMITWILDIDSEADHPLVAPVVIAKLSRLQQLAMATIGFNNKTGKYDMMLPSPKIEAVVDKIEDNESESIIVFSQFKTPLYLLKRTLEGRKVPTQCVTFTGDDDHKTRTQNMKRFMEGDVRIFLATIGAGGEGVDGLQTACKTMIFLDRAWSPMKNDQAVARLVRGGQTQSVNIIDIVARNTIDVERKRKISMKKKWILETLGDIS